MSFKVVLQNNITNEKYLFNCNRWLAKDEQDHKIELELSLESGTSDSKNKLRNILFKLVFLCVFYLFV